MYLNKNNYFKLVHPNFSKFLKKFLPNKTFFNIKKKVIGFIRLPTRGAGFTLIELLVVIGIIGILATIVMGGSHYAKIYAKNKKAYADLSTIAKSIDMLALDTSQWPGHQTPYIPCPTNCNSNEIEDLTVAISGIQATDGLFPNWRGPYIKNLPNDPWGTPYFFDTDYVTNGQTKAVVGSYGPNKQGLNNYDADDIVYVISH